jgi:hypothetical protein
MRGGEDLDEMEGLDDLAEDVTDEGEEAESEF